MSEGDLMEWSSRLGFDMAHVATDATHDALLMLSSVCVARRIILGVLKDKGMSQEKITETLAFAVAISEKVEVQFTKGEESIIVLPRLGPMIHV